MVKQIIIDLEFSNFDSNIEELTYATIGAFIKELENNNIEVLTDIKNCIRGLE